MMSRWSKTRPSWVTGAVCGFRLINYRPWENIIAHSVTKTISEKLTRAFEPAGLEVIDESHLHAGHAGARPDGESHFRVKIVSQIFDGLSLVARHRLVNEALADELKDRVHALAISAKSPAEDD